MTQKRDARQAAQAQSAEAESDADDSIDGLEPPVASTVETFLIDDGWPITQLEGSSLLQTRFRGKSGEWSCYVEISEEPAQVIFYSIAPVFVPEDRRARAVELLIRLNSELGVGSFDMDIEEGEIRFRSSVIVDGSPITAAMVRPIVYLNVAMMDHYLPSLMTVVSSYLAPAQIVEMAENMPT